MAMGLIRVQFRRLRELIHDDTPPPRFDRPDLWLFNRLAAELSAWIYSRASEPLRVSPFADLWQRAAKVPSSGAATDFLRLLSVRTFDLEAAQAKISPALEHLGAIRQKARRVSREANLRIVFKPGQVAFVDPNTMETITDGDEPRVAVEHASNLPLLNLTPEGVRERAYNVFEQSPGLTHHLILADGPQRVIATAKGKEPTFLTPSHKLPTDLPFAQPAKEHLASALLQWRFTDEVNHAIKDVASVPLIR